MADENWTVIKAPSAAAAPAEETWSVQGPSGVRQERGFLEKTGDLLKRAQIEGIGGTIAYPALRAQGWTPEQIRQAKDDVLADLDAKDRADFEANPDESLIHKALTLKWLPHIFATVGGQPEWLLGGGGEGLARRLAYAAGSAEAVDATTQGIQNAQGMRDGIDFQRINDIGAMTAGLGTLFEGAGGLLRKLKGAGADAGRVMTPEEQAAHDALVEQAVKANPNISVEELTALGVKNAEQVHAALQAGKPVGKPGPVVETGRPGTVANNLDEFMQPKDVPVYQPNTKGAKPTNVANDAGTVELPPHPSVTIQAAANDTGAYPPPEIEIPVYKPSTKDPDFLLGPEGANDYTDPLAVAPPESALTPQAEPPGPKPLTPPDPEAFVEPVVSPNGKLVHEVTSDTAKNKSVYAHYTAEAGKEPVKFGVLIDKGTGEATININVDKIDTAPEHAGDYGDKAVREGLKDVLREYPEITSIGGIRKRGAKGLKDTEQKIPAAVITRLRNQIAKEDAAAAEAAATKKALSTPANDGLTPFEAEVQKRFDERWPQLQDEMQKVHADKVAELVDKESGPGSYEQAMAKQKFGPVGEAAVHIGKAVEAADAHINNEWLPAQKAKIEAEVRAEITPPTSPPLTPQQAMEKAAAELRAKNAAERAAAEADTVLHGEGRLATPIAEGEVPKYAGSINLERMDSTHAVDEIIAEQAKSIPRDYVPNAETEARAAEMVGEGVQSLLAKNPNLKDSPAHLVALGNLMLEATNRVVELKDAWRAGKNSDADLLAFQKAVLTQRLLQERVNASAGSVARTLQALNIIRKGGGDYAKALAELGKTGEALASRDSIDAFAQAIQGINDPAVISKVLRDTTKKTLWDKIMSVRYNMMLSGPRTHFANNIGIFSNVAGETMAHAMAVVVGQGRRFSPNAERVAARELAARVEGAVSALVSGAAWKNARKALNEGDILDATGKAEHQINGESSKMALVELPSRALNAEDEFWRTIIHNSEIYGLAHRQALKEGLKGAEFKERVQDIIDNPTKAMVAEVENTTHRILFRDKASPLVDALQTARRIKSKDHWTLKTIKGASQIVFPFLRTPDRLLMTPVRWSPLAGLDRHAKADFAAGGARADIAKARIAMGTALATWAAVKAFNGEITGQGPQNYDKKQELMAGGWRPNSIRVGDEYRDISNLQPFSSYLTGVATLVERAQNGYESEASYAQKAKQLTGDIVAALGGNTWTRPVEDLAKVFTGSEAQSDAAFGNYAANVANSFSPAFMRQANQAAGDQSVRATTGDGSVGDKIIGKLAASSPMNSSELPQKYDVYGQPMMREGSLGPDFLSNVNISSISKDPTIRELHRLAVLNPGKGALVSPVDKNMEIPQKYGGGRIKLDAGQEQEYQKLAGEYLTAYVRGKMEDGSWAKMTDEERMADLGGRSGAVADAKAAARRDLFFEPIDTTEWTVGQPKPAGQAGEAQSNVEAMGARVTSGNRTREEQQWLYDHYSGVAKPGTSRHEKDRAIDLVPSGRMTPQSVIQDLENDGYVNVRVNTKKHGSGRHWHVQWDNRVTQ